MSADWWALEVVEPLYDLECPRPRCDRHFRQLRQVRVHLRQDHGFSWEFTAALMNEAVES